MPTVLARGQNGTSGSYDIVPIPNVPGVGGGLGFDPTNASAWAQAVGQAPNGVGGTGNVGTFSFTAGGGGPRTFAINVRPFASLIDTVPGTLYVNQRLSQVAEVFLGGEYVVPVGEATWFQLLPRYRAALRESL